jgi:O-antigen/teichoic acid export membrane protein
MKVEELPVTETAHRESFFRQSGWLMIANVGGGAFMWAVHFLNKFIPPGQYGDFGVFLAVVMLVPGIPLQMVMAQQTAKGLATGRQGEVAALFRMVWLGTTALWLIGAAMVLVFQQQILTRWQMSSPIGLWITLLIMLLSLWLPLWWGILQGQQNFLWMGWSMMSNGIGRLSAAAIAVLVVHAYATGMILGVLLGMIVAGIVAAWHSRAVWLVKPEPFDWRGMLGQIVPLFIGFLGFQVLFTTDTIAVKSFFPPIVADCYVGAGTLSRALMWLVLPLASVMFPRIVQSAAKTEKTNLMNVVLIGTAVLAIAGAAALSILGPWVVRLVYNPAFVLLTSSLLPWYVGAMVPLAVANVLLNNLLAKPTWAPSICVLGVAVLYVVALTRFHGSLIAVLQTMAVFNLLLLLVCAWFTWGWKAKPRPEHAP